MMYYKKQNKNPNYKFSNFKKACKDINRISIYSIAREGACKYFNLRTKKRILNFILSNGLENLALEHTKILENNKNENNPIMVDSYKFKSGNKKGYIAFFFDTIKNIWYIKSFKLDRDMNDQMAQAIKKSDIIKKYGWEDLS